MDIFTPFRIISSLFIGSKNLFFIHEKKDARSKPYLFIDMTEIHHNDYGTGVPRVTKNIEAFLEKQNLPFEIKKVYAKPHNKGFYYCEDDSPIKIQKGDFFFGLDFSKFKIPSNNLHINKLRKNGIPVWFFVHDLIPVTFPQYCTENDIKAFKKWIKIVSKADGFIANSKATMNETNDYILKLKGSNKNIKSGFIHLGSSFMQHSNKNEKNHEEKPLNFLAVSTVEPRKRYDLIVQAFDSLWKEGIDCSLTIVGKHGWNNESVFQLIKTNPEYNKRLIWYENYISDEDLNELYSKSDALVFASDTEGFGVPLVEAASYGKPLIIRNIPIFHEVAGDNAYYFDGKGEKNLKECIRKFSEDFKNGITILPEIKLYSWNQSAAEVAEILFKNS